MIDAQGQTCNRKRTLRPTGIQFSLSGLLELVVWCAFAFAFLGTKVHTNYETREFNAEWFASSFIAISLLGAGFGCLWHNRWLGLVVGMILGLSPIIMLVGLQVLLYAAWILQSLGR